MELIELLETRNAQVLATNEEEREDADEGNPVLFAEQGPNRFALMSLFFTDDDGVQIQEDLDVNEITVRYFTDTESVELTSGAVYDWAIKFFNENY